MDRRSLLVGAGALGVLGAANLLSRSPARAAESYPVSFTPAQWHARLSPAAFAVLRQQQTEMAGTSPLLNEHRRGTFNCAGCDQAAFSTLRCPMAWRPRATTP